MRLPSKRQTFWLLMAASAIGFALPARLTSPARRMFDPVLGALGGWLHGAGQDVRARTGELTGRIADDQAARQIELLRAERDRLLVELHRYRELDGQLSEATGLRRELVGYRGRVVPCGVLVRDAVAWRESFLVDRGLNVKIRPKQWAAGQARAFLDRGDDSGLFAGQWAVMPLTSPAARELLARSVLVGQVEEVGQVTARVKLLTDPDSQVAGQLYDPATRRLGATCIVRGDGPGVLLVDGVAPPVARAGQPNVDQPPAKPGDLVLTAAGAVNLPAQLQIGVVREVKPRPDNPLEYTLRIAPAVEYADLQRLFVIDPMPPAADREDRR